ncbi:hydroxyethylthiazole kinase [Legionella beliardensis]|uniref:Hydroxyethylthiazole kinase n=1 Tax=Legionella beliardensis TaxID=91822 RepID=A0A378HYE2_9GAMM|nr:hydroxyethylthiazole kinase [Legionella beliardensis]STX27917.1 hydroxyethylthiazole kinase [Legionella beliardensis]
MQYETVYRIVQQIKEQRPLMLNITNQVTMGFVANGLLSLGASPIMTQGLAEIRDLIHLSDGIIINIGTLTDEFLALCEQACLVANELGKPIIFDPVGAGASQYRTQACLHLLKQYQFATIRGNASEISALCRSTYTTKGVDASITTAEALDTATCFSTEYKVVLVISGQTDAVIQGTQINLFARGSELMPAITGSGCLLTAIIGAFQACSSDAYLAACAAVVFYGICGERAAYLAEGPGSFKVHFLDTLAKLPQRGDYDHE